MYARVYRSGQYERMRANVLALLERNARRGGAVGIAILLRPDRSLWSTIGDADMGAVLAFRPVLDFTWSYQNGSGRIGRESLSGRMTLKPNRPKREPCLWTYIGPTILADGTVLACRCVSAMDAAGDLGIGNAREEGLDRIWRSGRLAELRRSFGTPRLNKTCQACSSYRNLDYFRTARGRRWAQGKARAHTGRAGVLDDLFLGL
jgi:radical SAM protein with 4Fe4S-binding SPASM domain